MDAKTGLENVLKIVIEKEGLKNAHIEYENVGASGYICEVNIVNIKHDNGVLSLFLKRLPDDHSEAAGIVFTNEMNFYKNVIPEFLKLDLSISSYVPKCYYVDSEFIFLENLCVSGMKVWDNLKVPFDEEHIVAVIERYGNFHAVSSVLKLQSPAKFNEISKKVDILKFALLKIEKENYRHSMGKKAAAAFSPDQRKYADAFMEFIEGNLYESLSNISDDNENDVIVHGDSWHHNFFFKYKESRLIKMYLIDFQLSFQASPITDLSYLMCTSGCSKQHFDGMDKYLKIYHDSFSNKMKELGCQPGQIISIGTLKDQWKNKAKYGLIWGMIVNKMLIAERDELVANTRDEVILSFDFISRNEELYHNKMRDCIRYFYENEML